MKKRGKGEPAARDAGRLSAAQDNTHPKRVAGMGRAQTRAGSGRRRAAVRSFDKRIVSQIKLNQEEVQDFPAFYRDSPRSRLLPGCFWRSRSVNRGGQNGGACAQAGVHPGVERTSCRGAAAEPDVEPGFSGSATEGRFFPVVTRSRLFPALRRRSERLLHGRNLRETFAA